MVHKLKFPEQVAICFMSMDGSISKRQLDSLQLDTLNFKSEIYLRSERNQGQYQTFAQMINEAIDETNSEFMIFMNPKVVANKEDLVFLIDKLISGYCFASLFGLAFFAISKELIRKIGMLDESFSPIEYEDDDFLVRLRLFNKKIYWGQDWSKYNYHQSYCPPNRGSSLTKFWNKWWLKDDMLYNTDQHIHKQISRRHILSNDYIFDSWDNFDQSWGEGHIYDKIMSYHIQDTDKSPKMIDSLIDVNIDYRDNSYFHIELNSNVDTAISCSLNRIGDRTPIISQLIHNNTWHRFPVDHFETKIELRIYHDGSIVYINQIESPYKLNLKLKLPSLLLI